MKISIIVPLKNDSESFFELLDALEIQQIKPNELIIVDSSINNMIEKKLKNHFFSFNIRYLKTDNKYPGEARNIGIKNSKYDLIAFLDSKTIPHPNWLKDQKEKLLTNNLDVIFGKTKYVSKSKFQDLVKAASFGDIDHITTPGSLIKKKILYQNFFIEGVRTADDLEWRERLKKNNHKIGLPHSNQLIYKSLPNSIFSLLKRYFIYSFHTAQVNVDNKLKYFYFFLTSFLLFLVIPRWNHYIPEWNVNHALYIQNHTKIYLLIFLFFFLCIVSLQNLPIFKKTTYNYVIKFIFLSLIFIFVYNWNNYIANWIDKSVFYFPHITKIFLLIVFAFSFLIRGIYYPMLRKIKTNFLFPVNWIKVGLYGFFIDLVKTPSYIYGALIPSFFLKKYSITQKNTNLVFYSKYAELSPSYRTRFLSYKNFFNSKNIKVVTKELFDEKFYKLRIFNNKTDYLKILKFYYLRLKDLIFRKKPFIAIVHVELLPYIPFIAEIILKIRNIPYVIDIDDAVYFRFKNKNIILNKFDNLKFKYMFTNSSAILAGNNFHYNYVKRLNNNVQYFPTSIDFKKYDISKYKKKHRVFTIVWIGTPSTTFYIKPIIKMLNALKKNRNINLKIIGSDVNSISELNCSFVDWNQNTEIEELSKCHVGIMPLNNSNWELGKCAYKILQYMSLKIPVVASPVGINKKIIKDNENGFLAYNDDDWYNKINDLIDNIDLWKKISNNGYETVKKQFNLENYKLPYLKIINQINNIYE